VEYLCDVAKATRDFKDAWRMNHRRYYHVAGITLQVESDIPFMKNTFAEELRPFEASGQGTDTFLLRHHFFVPDLTGVDLGEEVARRPPQVIHRKNGTLIYLEISSAEGERQPQKAAEFNLRTSRARIFSRHESDFLQGGLRSPSLFPSDLDWLPAVLADRNAFLIQASGIAISDMGVLVADDSKDAGRLRDSLMQFGGEILSLGHVIVRHWPNGFHVHGFWSQPGIPQPSAALVQLQAILLLEWGEPGKPISLTKPDEALPQIETRLIRSPAAVDSSKETSLLVQQMIREIPTFRVRLTSTDEFAGIARRVVAGDIYEDRTRSGKRRRTVRTPSRKARS
jgi:hypothetical protein